MRSENFDWFRELGADIGKTPNSLLKSSKIFTTSSRREWRSSKARFPAGNLPIRFEAPTHHVSSQCFDAGL